MALLNFSLKDNVCYAFILCAFILFNPGKPTIDDYLRLVEATMIVNHGRFDVDPQYLPETGYIFYPAEDGKLYTHWGLFSSVVYIPAELLGKICRVFYPGIREIEQSHDRPLLFQRFIVSMLILPGIMLMNAILMNSILRGILKIENDRLLALLLTCAFLGTQLFRYSSGFEVGLTICSCLLAIVLYESPMSGRARGLGIGLVAGFMLNARYIAFPIFFLFPIFDLLRGRKSAHFFIYLLVGLLPYAIIALLYNYIRYESFSPAGFFLFHAQLFGDGHHDLVRQTIGDMVGYIIDRTIGSEGLFVFSPILILAPYGVWFALIKNRNISSPAGRLLIFSSLIVSYYLIFHAMFGIGDADTFSWGPRYLTTTVPFLFILSVPAIKAIADRWAHYRKYSVVWVFTVFIGVASFSIQLLSVLGWEETEKYQGRSRNQIVQRASNLWRMSVDGNPWAPHENAEKQLFVYQMLNEQTNQGGELISQDIQAKRLYEGFSIWPVTVGYSLKWDTWVVVLLASLNFVGVLALGYFCFSPKNLSFGRWGKA